MIMFISPLMVEILNSCRSKFADILIRAYVFLTCIAGKLIAYKQNGSASLGSDVECGRLLPGGKLSASDSLVQGCSFDTKKIVNAKRYMVLNPAKQKEDTPF